jgi:hypothetical protein
MRGSVACVPACEQRVLLRIVRVERLVQGLEVEVEAAAVEAAAVRETIGLGAVRGLDREPVGQRVPAERGRALQVHLRVGEVDLVGL